MELLVERLQKELKKIKDENDALQLECDRLTPNVYLYLKNGLVIPICIPESLAERELFRMPRKGMMGDEKIDSFVGIGYPSCMFYSMFKKVDGKFCFEEIG